MLCFISGGQAGCSDQAAAAEGQHARRRLNSHTVGIAMLQQEVKAQGKYISYVGSSVLDPH
jgi:hypothetical protein